MVTGLLNSFVSAICAGMGIFLFLFLRHELGWTPWAAIAASLGLMALTGFVWGAIERAVRARRNSN